MKPGEHPTAFGVFKPIGHVVAAFPAGTPLDAVEAALAAAGIVGQDVQRLSPEQMKVQADTDIAQASPLASIGQELNLVKAQRELALLGHSFLVIKTDDDEQVDSVEGIARSFSASRAQHYGRWLVTELVEVGATDQQVNESPDRGLDAQTPSGTEEVKL